MSGVIWGDLEVGAGAEGTWWPALQNGYLIEHGPQKILKQEKRKEHPVDLDS